MEENTGRLPFVSVFVPARDEESGLEDCLLSLLHQDYPGGYEVLFADDGSSDKTWQIACRIKEEYPVLQIFQVDESEYSLQGKQRALAQLSDRAAGDVFLFCDADMLMPVFWIRNMVLYLSSTDADIVNGTTCPLVKTVFDRLQALDWLLPQAVLSTLSSCKLAYTAMGNNMGMSRKVYESVGGYRNIPFSVTEDYELFRQLKKKGFFLRHLFTQKVLGYTRPAENYQAWFSQHLRWTRGFKQLPFLMQLPFYLLLVHFPIAISLSLTESWRSIGLMLMGLWFVKITFFLFRLQHLRKARLLAWIIFYECLFPPVYLLLFFTSLLNKSLKWKGRSYPGIFS